MSIFSCFYLSKISNIFLDFVGHEIYNLDTAKKLKTCECIIQFGRFLTLLDVKGSIIYLNTICLS